MGFIEDAQAVVRGEATPAPAALPDWVDLARCRRVMWKSLGDMESPWFAHEKWSPVGRLERFVVIAAAEVAHGLALISNGDRCARLLDAIVQYAIQDRSSILDELTELEALEVRRVVAVSVKALRFVEPASTSLREWALDMGFIEDNDRTTPLGSMFSHLRGKNALQFVLEVGAMLSLGWDDKVRVSRDALRTLKGKWEGEISECPELLEHAIGLGVGTYLEVGPEYVELTVTPGLEDLVDTVLSDEPNPIRALAEALLASEVGELHARTTGAPPPNVDSGYSRIVLHELNNSLLPLGTALNKLWATLGTPGPHDPEQLAALRGRIDRQVERLQHFATESGRLLEATAPENFPLSTVLSEAERETEGERNGRIGVQVAIDAVTLEGSRGRWVLCFVNLFRNAAQARAGRGMVRVSTEWDATGRLHVYVDDDGPGVPEELRERIFDQGVSQRGGTGLGLFEARTTVRQSGGTLTCEESPMGGARFHIHVPARRSA